MNEQEQTEQTTSTWPSLDTKESIKLIHNSKGYNWEIKVFIENKEDLMALKRLEQLDQEVKRRIAGQ